VIPTGRRAQHQVHGTRLRQNGYGLSLIHADTNNKNKYNNNNDKNNNNNKNNYNHNNNSLCFALPGAPEGTAKFEQSKAKLSKAKQSDAKLGKAKPS
jgi:hypothetical protein